MWHVLWIKFIGSNAENSLNYKRLPRRILFKEKYMNELKPIFKGAIQIHLVNINTLIKYLVHGWTLRNVDLRVLQYFCVGCLLRHIINVNSTCLSAYLCTYRLFLFYAHQPHVFLIVCEVLDNRCICSLWVHICM